MLKEIPEIRQQELFEICFKNAILSNNKVAMWRLPNEHTKHVVVDFSEPSTSDTFSLENNTPGFILSPFYTSPSEPLNFIKADIYLNTSSGQDSWAWEEYQSRILQFNSLNSKKSKSSLPSLDPVFHNTNKEHYLEIIRKALERIDLGHFKKVVVARRKQINTSAAIDPVQLFHILCEAYQSAFVSLIYHPTLGCWIGATPELLVSIDKNNTFKTIALAGTQKINPEMDLSQITWNQKEIEEQAYVNRYIANCFKAIQVRDYEENGPRTIAAGNLAHLRTDFSVNIDKSRIPSLGSIMLKLLHPTSAVCGMPKESSMDFIRTHEQFDRELYSGFLGPININQQSHTFVNIRSARLYQHNAILYGGAGITKDSNPEKEWIETELKMNIIQNHILL